MNTVILYVIAKALKKLKVKDYETNLKGVSRYSNAYHCNEKQQGNLSRKPTILKKCYFELFKPNEPDKNSFFQ